MSGEAQEKEARLRSPAWDSKRLLFALFLVLAAVYSLAVWETTGDSAVYFSRILNEWELGDYLAARYQGWSSRLLIEAVVTLLARFGTDTMLWRLINIGMYALLLASMMRLTHHREDVLVIGLMLLYPVLRFSSAGWMTTYIFYLWPLALGLFALTSLGRLYRGERIRPAMAAVYLLCELFAANMEVFAAVYTGLLLWLVFRMAMEKKRPSAAGALFLALQGAASVGNLIFAMTCPGNWVRNRRETAQWMPEFDSLSIVEKLRNGVNSTFSCLTDLNILFFCFVLLLFLTVWCRPGRTPLQLAAAGYPLLVVLLRTAAKPLARVWFPSFNAQLDAVLTTEQYANSYFPFHQAPFTVVRPGETLPAVSTNSGIPYFIYLMMFLAILATLLHAFGPSWTGGQLAVVFCAGIASRLVMGFSPTLYASGTRTFIFLDFALVYGIVRIYAEKKELLRAHERLHRWLVMGFWALAAAAVLDNIMSVCTIFT